MISKITVLSLYEDSGNRNHSFESLIEYVTGSIEVMWILL